MQISTKLIFLLLLLSGNAFALKVKSGAVPTGVDPFGEPVYKLSDIIPEPKPLGLFDFAIPTLYNGEKSLSNEFPYMGWLGMCTSTNVGDNVIFTAAHCVNTGSKINYQHRGSGKTYKGTCYRHTNYNDRTVYNDWVLCILDENLPAGTLHASFDTTAMPSKGDEMLASGYGRPNLGTHYWGKAVVESMEEQDIVTCGPTNLGGGDSGGSLINWVNDRVSAVVAKIRGVNSRASSRCSYYNSVAHKNFIDWAKKLGEDRKVGICGVNKVCGMDDPTVCPEERSIVDTLKKNLLFWEKQLNQCVANARNRNAF